MTPKEKILKTKAEHPDWNSWQISQKTGIPFSNVDYHFNPKRKERAKTYAASYRRKSPITEKIRSFCRSSNATQRKYLDKIPVEDVIAKLGKNPVCYLTGVPLDLTDGKSFSFDHRIPLSKGGTSTLENLEICTIEANVSKNGFTLNEFLEFCKSVLTHHGFDVRK